jgi:hypothetical protein
MIDKQFTMPSFFPVVDYNYKIDSFQKMMYSELK